MPGTVLSVVSIKSITHDPVLQEPAVLLRNVGKVSFWQGI